MGQCLFSRAALQVVQVWKTIKNGRQKYLTNCRLKSEERKGLITATECGEKQQRMCGICGPGAEKNLTRFSLQQSTICGCNISLGQRQRRHLSRMVKKKRNMGDTRWKKGRKDVPSLSSIGGCVSRHLSCGRAIKTKQTAATHVCQFLHLIGPKD